MRTLLWLFIPSMFIAFLVFGILDYVDSDPGVWLSLKEWECTTTYKDRTLSGKVWMVQVRCANYSRKEI